MGKAPWSRRWWNPSERRAWARALGQRWLRLGGGFAAGFSVELLEELMGSGRAPGVSVKGEESSMIQ
jgi:hypothetical protein